MKTIVSDENNDDQNKTFEHEEHIQNEGRNDKAQGMRMAKAKETMKNTSCGMRIDFGMKRINKTEIKITTT